MMRAAVTLRSTEACIFTWMSDAVQGTQKKRRRRRRKKKKEEEEKEKKQKKLIIFASFRNNGTVSKYCYNS